MCLRLVRLRGGEFLIRTFQCLPHPQQTFFLPRRSSNPDISPTSNMPGSSLNGAPEGGTRFVGRSHAIFRCSTSATGCGSWSPGPLVTVPRSRQPWYRFGGRTAISQRIASLRIRRQPLAGSETGTPRAALPDAFMNTRRPQDVRTRRRPRHAAVIRTASRSLATLDPPAPRTRHGLRFYRKTLTPPMYPTRYPHLSLFVLYLVSRILEFCIRSVSAAFSRRTPYECLSHAP